MDTEAILQELVLQRDKLNEAIAVLGSLETTDAVKTHKTKGWTKKQRDAQSKRLKDRWKNKRAADKVAKSKTKPKAPKQPKA